LTSFIVLSISSLLSPPLKPLASSIMPAMDSCLAASASVRPARLSKVLLISHEF